MVVGEFGGVECECRVEPEDLERWVRHDLEQSGEDGAEIGEIGHAVSVLGQETLDGLG